MGNESETQFCNALVTARRVTKDMFCREVDCGNAYATNMLSGNVALLEAGFAFALFYFDVESVPSEQRQAVGEQVERIKAAVLAFNHLARKRQFASTGRDLNRLWRQYLEVVQAGRGFVALAFPHLCAEYDFKFGVAC